MRRAILFLILFTLLFCPCITYAQADSYSSFTLLIYMAGGDLESRGQAATSDILEMVDSLQPDCGIRILLQAGGAETWNLDIDPSKTTRIEITSGSWDKIEENNSLNMADAQTLEDFLKWGYSYAPADQYGLILWNHGAGPLLGVCLDELHPDPVTGRDSLSMIELESALQSSPFQHKKLAFIGFDACMMNSMEIASLASPFAEYMIGSQEITPPTGWDYSFLNNLSGSAKGKEWCESIISSFQNYYINSSAPTTLSCIDLNKTDNVVSQMELFFSSLSDKITSENYPAYTRCRAAAKTFGSITTSAYDLIDFFDLIDLYERQGLEDTKNLQNAVREMIVCNYTHKSDHTYGISIYYPYSNMARYISSWSSIYEQSSFSPAYRSFIRKISQHYMYDSLFNTTSEHHINLLDEGGGVRVRMPLSKEEIPMISRSRMLVLEKIATDSYRLIYYNDQDVEITDHDASCRYSGEALYVINKDHEIIAGPVTYFPADKGISVSGLLFYGEKQYAAKLVYQMNEEGHLVLAQILTAQENGMFLPSSLDPLKSTELILFSSGPSGEGESTITSLNFTTYFPDYQINLDLQKNDWEFAFVPGWSHSERYVYLRLSDVYDKTICSNPLIIPSSTHLSIVQPQELKSDGNLSANLLRGSLVSGNDSGLLFSLYLYNHSDKELNIDTYQINLNDNISLIPRDYQAFPLIIEPDSGYKYDIFIPIDVLQSIQLPDMLTNVSIVFNVIDNKDYKYYGQVGDEYAVSFPLSLDTFVLYSPSTENHPQQNSQYSLAQQLTVYFSELNDFVNSHINVY